jgi:hypothetical protein
MRAKLFRTFRFLGDVVVCFKCESAAQLSIRIQPLAIYNRLSSIVQLVENILGCYIDGDVVLSFLLRNQSFDGFLGCGLRVQKSEREKLPTE